jgi:UDP-glucose:(glucosyl)LPS alpha-1,2-glucosyltransferase
MSASAPKLLIATVLPPREGFGPGRTGAVGLIVHRLAAAAPDSRFRSAILCGEQAGPVFTDVETHVIRPPWWRVGNVNLRYAAGALGVLRRLSPALVEVHNRPEMALALAAALPEIPVSLILHNDPQTMRQTRSVAERSLLLSRLARVVTVSEFLRRRLLDGVPDCSRPPDVLPNCIDLAALPPAAERERTILFVGRVVPEKAPDAFVAACAAALPRLPGWRAEIIGADRFRNDSPDTGFVRAVRTAAQAGGISLLGYRDHPDVLAAMARAAIVVMPSRWQEPFGLTALEAMASGAVLLCSPRGGLPEVGGDAAIYVNPDDPVGMADEIVALASDFTRLAMLSRAGHERAKKFDLEPTRRRLDAIRTNILSMGALADPTRARGG